METDEGATGKRQRVSRACDMCRKKKVKCDGVTPVCTNCQLLNYSCTFKDTAKKRGPPKGYIDAIETKLFKLESLLTELLGSEGRSQDMVLEELRQLQNSNPVVRSKKTGHPHHSTRTSPASSLGSQALVSSAYTAVPSPGPTQIGNNQPDTATAFTQQGLYDRDTLHRVNRDINLMAIDEHGNQRYCGQASGLWLLRESPTFQKGLLNQGGLATGATGSCPFTSVDQVPREVEERLVRGYFEHIYPIFPLVIPRVFWASYWDHSNPVPYHLKLALLACVARFIDLGPVVNGDSEGLANLYFDALNPYLVRYMYTSSVTMVQTLLLASIYQHGRMSNLGWKLCGNAINIAIDLGLHRDPDLMGLARPTQFEVETRRRTWWCCYILDTLSGAALGRPTMIKGLTFDTDFPQLEDDYEVLAQIIRGDNPETTEESQDNASSTTISSPSSMVGPGLASHPDLADSPRPALLYSVRIHFPHFLSLISLLNRVVYHVYGYRPAFYRKTTHPDNPGLPVAQLDKQLRSWLINLPDDLKYGPSDYLNLHHGPHRFVLYLYMVYHTTIILLHRPFLAYQWHVPVVPPGDGRSPLTTPDTSRGGGPPYDLQRLSIASAELSSLQICTSAAAAVQCIMYTSVRKTRSVGSLFSIYTVMTAGTLHLHNALSPDPDFAMAAKSYLRLCLETLVIIGRRWLIAVNLHKVMTELIQQREIDLASSVLPPRLDPKIHLRYALAVPPERYLKTHNGPSPEGLYQQTPLGKSPDAPRSHSSQKAPPTERMRVPTKGVRRHLTTLHLPNDKCRQDPGDDGAVPSENKGTRTTPEPSNGKELDKRIPQYLPTTAEPSVASPYPASTKLGALSSHSSVPSLASGPFRPGQALWTNMMDDPRINMGGSSVLTSDKLDRGSAFTSISGPERMSGSATLASPITSGVLPAMLGSGGSSVNTLPTSPRQETSLVGVPSNLTPFTYPATAPPSLPGTPSPNKSNVAPLSPLPTTISNSTSINRGTLASSGNLASNLPGSMAMGPSTQYMMPFANSYSTISRQQMDPYAIYGAASYNPSLQLSSGSNPAAVQPTLPSLTQPGIGSNFPNGGVDNTKPYLSAAEGGTDRPLPVHYFRETSTGNLVGMLAGVGEPLIPDRLNMVNENQLLGLDSSELSIDYDSSTFLPGGYSERTGTADPLCMSDTSSVNTQGFPIFDSRSTAPGVSSNHQDNLSAVASSPTTTTTVGLSSGEMGLSQAPFIPTRGQNQSFFTNLDNFFFSANMVEMERLAQLTPPPPTPPTSLP